MKIVVDVDDYRSNELTGKGRRVNGLFYQTCTCITDKSVPIIYHFDTEEDRQEFIAENERFCREKIDSLK